ncbi:MAG: hypothetical protein ABF535_12935 [Acetobacter sp.]
MPRVAYRGLHFAIVRVVTDVVRRAALLAGPLITPGVGAAAPGIGATWHVIWDTVRAGRH